MKNTDVKAVAVPQSKTLSIVTVAFSALLGLAIVSVAGHVQAAAMHDAAHDVRHATGFPCH